MKLSKPKDVDSYIANSGRVARPKPSGKEPEPRVPTDLHKALATTKAKAQWRDLTPIARRDFVSWIDTAKESEIRTHKIEKACDMLAAGKRHPV